MDQVKKSQNLEVAQKLTPEDFENIFNSRTDSDETYGTQVF